MDYFDSNMKDKMSKYDNNLPPDMAWEDMRKGVYEKMGKKTSYNPWKWFSLGLLLLIAGCGGWMAVNYLNEDSKIEIENKATAESQIIPEAIEQSDGVKKLNDKEATSPIEQSGSAKNIATKDKVNTSSNSNRFSSPAFGKKKENKAVQLKSEKGISSFTNENILNSTDAIAKTNLEDKANRDEEDKIEKLEIQSIPSNRENITGLGLSKLINKTTLLIPTKRKFNPEWTNANSTEKKNVESEIQEALWSASLMAGITNWSAFSSDNPNSEFISGFPGYSMGAELSYSLSKNHALSFGYQHSLLQEKLDYEATKAIEVNKPNTLVQQYVSSLTGNVLHQNYADTSAQASRYIRELKYNTHRLHTVHLSYTYVLVLQKKSCMRIQVGGEYLFNIQSEGKRLDANEELFSFDKSFPVFDNNQFALRLALAYEYRIGSKTSVFTQIGGSKYLTNWELQNNGATRPLTYNLSLGLRQHF